MGQTILNTTHVLPTAIYKGEAIPQLTHKQLLASPSSCDLTVTMLFRNLAVPAALFVHGAYATLTPDQVVTNINIVTTASQGILNAVTPITKNSSPGDVVTAGQVCSTRLSLCILLTYLHRNQTATTNFNTIIQNLGGDVSAMDGTVFTAAQAVPVCAALTDVRSQR